LLSFSKIGYLSDIVDHFKEDEFINKAIENIQDKNSDLKNKIEVYKEEVSKVERKNEGLENIISKNSFIKNNCYTITIVLVLAGLVIYATYPNIAIDLQELSKLINCSRDSNNKYDELSKKIDVITKTDKHMEKILKAINNYFNPPEK
jgi:cell division septum initiation protein DivIVA